MRDLLIAKVETDPLIHWGGIFNTAESLIILSIITIFLFIPIIKNGRYKGLLLLLFLLLPLLNIYYRNTHQFVGGVFIGHLLYMTGILIGVMLEILESQKSATSPDDFIKNKKQLFLLLIIFIFLVKAVFVLGSRPTDSGIYSGTGAILYLTGSSPFRDYWGVVSIGSRYGPALYLAYLPFVPLAYLTRYLLWGDALTPWNSISNVPLTVATSSTGALFYEALIIFIFIKSFRRYGLYAALIFLLNPLNSIILSVNANELPQTAFFLLGIYLLRKPVLSGLSLIFSSMMKIYPISGLIQFVFIYQKDERRRFVLTLIISSILFFTFWLFEATHAPLELRTNPLRDIFLYQKNPGKFHSIWYFVDTLISPYLSYILMAMLLLFILYGIYKTIRTGMNSISSALRISILIFASVVVINRSIHPGYYYFIQTLILYLFFLEEEVDKDSGREEAKTTPD